MNWCFFPSISTIFITVFILSSFEKGGLTSEIFFHPLEHTLHAYAECGVCNGGQQYTHAQSVVYVPVDSTHTSCLRNKH